MKGSRFSEEQIIGILRAKRRAQADPAYEHHMMEALWVHQWHNVVDAEFKEVKRG